MVILLPAKKRFEHITRKVLVERGINYLFSLQQQRPSFIQIPRYNWVKFLALTMTCLDPYLEESPLEIYHLDAVEV